jgi:hypothetical protein
MAPVEATVGSLIVALAEPSVGEPVDVAEPALVSVSPADRVVKVVKVTELIVLEFEFEFAVEEPEPSSPHATVRADIKDRRHALRFISW